MDIRVIDNFHPDPGAIRAAGLAADYIDWPAPDGEVYKRVWIGEIPGLRDCIEAHMGPVEMLAMGFRLNFAGEMPNAAIHSDLGWGTHALVLYLCDGPGGTAFWRHKATGHESVEFGQQDVLDSVKADWNTPSAWEPRRLVELKFNRGLIYPGSLFHSRFPFEAFGTGADDGRLIAVAFFTPRSQ